MKRIAVQFFGHLRTYEKTYKSFLKNIVAANQKDGYEVDIFLHTWTEKDHTTISFRNPNGEELLNSKLNENDREMVQSIYHPKKILFEDQIKCEEKIFFEKLYNSKKSFKGVLNMTYSIYRVNELRKEYEENLESRYDWIIVTRPDIEFFTPFRIDDFLDAYNKSNQAVPKNAMFYATKIFARAKVNDLKFVGGSDLIYFSTPENMNKATELYKTWQSKNNFSDIYDKDQFFSFEFWFINYWKNQNLFPIAIDYVTIRDFFPKFNKTKLTMSNCKDKIKKKIFYFLQFILPYNFIVWFKNKYK